MELVFKDDVKGWCLVCRMEYDEDVILFDVVLEEELVVNV